ncbi:MAG: putative dependent transcriptional activator [Labilithrix sp.]|nr:putative dependent transcriptional activator [Labilithrix sp.]
MWYGLDVFDADLATFFHYLELGTQVATPKRSKAATAFTPERRARPDIFTHRFFEELGARLPRRAVLVFDDAHHLSPDSPVMETLANGTAFLRRDQRVLVLSREPPPPELARLEGSGGLARIHEDELALTSAETTAIVRLRRKTATVRRKEVDLLHGKTRGWVAGLVLLLDHTRSKARADTSTPDVVLEYLTTEYLGAFPEETRQLLTRLALLPRATQQTATALAGPQAGAILADLARRGMFVATHEGTPPAYELHPFVRELLLARGDAELGRAMVEARVTAARISAAEGDDDTAIDLFAASTQWRDILDLAHARAPALLLQGRNETLTRWLGLLPETFAADEPWVAYWRVSARIDLDPNGTAAEYERIFERFARSGDRIGQLLAWGGVAKGIVMAFDDMKPFDRWLEVFEALVPNIDDVPPPIALPLLAAVIAALNYRRLDHPRAEEWTNRAVDILREGQGDVASRILLAYIVKGNAWWRGNVARAALILQIFRETAETPQAPLFVQIYAAAAEAWSSWHHGELADCQSAVEAGLALARDNGLPWWDHNIIVTGALGACVAHDLPRARRRLEEANARLIPTQRLAVLHQGYASAWVALLEGDLTHALELTRRGLAIAREVGFPFGQATMLLAMAQVYLERDEHTLAEMPIEEVDALATATKSLAHRSQVALLRAQLAMRRGEDPTPHLAEGFALVRAVGLPLLATFMARRESLAALCTAALERNIENDTVRAFLRIRCPK